MGGVAGHMSHLYDNPSLTFIKMKDIMATVSEGELEAEEKVDGQNLFLSYSLADGKARGARNKGNVKEGGMGATELATKFAGRGNLERTFVEGFATFEKAVEALSDKEKLQIFGPNADIWYNAEVMDPGSRNVINYDNKTLKIHDRGHFRFDREVGEKADEDISPRLQILDRALGRMQTALGEEDFALARNAAIELQKLEDDVALKEAYSRLDRALGDAGVTDTDRVGTYVYNRIYHGIDGELSNEIKNDVVAYLMKLPQNIGLVNLKKKLTPEQKLNLKDIVDTKQLILKQAIEPIESIIHDFAVEILKSVQSVFIADNDAEVKRIRKELSVAVNAMIETGAEDPESMEILQFHLNKIKDMGKITTPIEGVVFDYDGHTYKFTGNFAPLNQILGLFKYGRKNKPLATESITNNSKVLTEVEGKRIALLPGGFKPPHAGHYELAKHLASLPDIDEVIVIIGKNARFDEDDKISIGAEQSKNLWDLYTQKDGNIQVRIQTGKTPVADVYDLIADPKEFSEGDTVILGKSDKDVDDTRFERAQSYAERNNPGVNVEEKIMPAFGGAGMGGTSLRNLIADDKKDTFLSKLPKHLNKADQEEVWEIVSPQSNEILNRLIDKQVDEVSTMGSGAVQGSGNGFGPPNTYNVYSRSKTRKPKIQRAKRQRRR